VHTSEWFCRSLNCLPVEKVLTYLAHTGLVKSIQSGKAVIAVI